MLERLRRLGDTGLGDLDETVTPRGHQRAWWDWASADMLTLLAAFRDEARALRRSADVR